MHDLAITLMVWASALSGYPLPSSPPPILVVHHAWFVHNVCQGVDTVDYPCEIVGLYMPTLKTIYLDISLEGDDRDSYLLHELTHYMQDLNGRYPKQPSCADKIEAEREAYAIQNRYIMYAQKNNEIIYVPVDKRLCHPH